MNDANDARRSGVAAYGGSQRFAVCQHPGEKRGGHLDQGLDGRPASTDNFRDSMTKPPSAEKEQAVDEGFARVR